MYGSLRVIAARATTNLRLITTADLAEDLLPTILPRTWEGKVLVNWDPGSPDHPSAELIQLLWERLQVCCALSISFSLSTSHLTEAYPYDFSKHLLQALFRNPTVFTSRQRSCLHSARCLQPQDIDSIDLQAAPFLMATM